MIVSRKKTTSMFVASSIVVASLSLASPLVRHRAQERNRTVTTARPSAEPAQTAEPSMRIALSTDTRAATISTTAKLLNASDLIGAPQSLEVSRVRVESRMLSSAPPAAQNIEVVVAKSLTHDDADRLVDSVSDLADEQAKAVSEPGGTWRVVVVKQSVEDAEETIGKLEAAGFDATTSFQTPTNDQKLPTNSGASGRATEPAMPTSATSSGAAKPTSSPSLNRVQLTSRASAPNREVVAFATGGAPFRSSAPMTFASSDEKNAPVRFNDKPYRGRIEVFANRRGSLTVVNVIGLEDYVRGVVPNELSFPALEALKAQAVAARTYALKNRGQFAPEGFDLLPTTRSQVYRGLSSETALTTRAVDETRGIIATYNGEPINALYTSTCGGRTEDAENIFNEKVPYLRGRECAAEARAPFAPFMVKSSRELFEIKDEKNLAFVRDLAVLAVHGFNFPLDKISNSWLADELHVDEARDWLTATARISRTASYQSPAAANEPPSFSTALIAAIFGEARADTLLNSADVNYLLSFRDGEEVPAGNRADVAMLIREGALTLLPDATLQPRHALSRGRALHAIARMLDERSSLALQKGTTRPTTNGALILRVSKGKEQPIVVSRDAFLFRQFGDNVYQMKSLALVGGEPVTFHVSARGEVDYLEVKPATDGASADRFSPFANWTTAMSLGAVQARLSRSVRGIGAVTDIRVARRGSSRRVIDLEVVGTNGIGHVRGGRIRSVLGLREQLFVIDRFYSGNDRVTGFLFIGRGWGHGVGMCQYGAYGLAKQGLNVEQILKTYYTGIDLTRLYN
jgi:peptidoglycan hydrolase-like amidase